MKCLFFCTHSIKWEVTIGLDLLFPPESNVGLFSCLSHEPLIGNPIEDRLPGETTVHHFLDCTGWPVVVRADERGPKESSVGDAQEECCQQPKLDKGP